MPKRYRWKTGLAGQVPEGLERGRCYGVLNHVDTHRTKANEYDLLDDAGDVVARRVPINCPLEPCSEAD